LLSRTQVIYIYIHITYIILYNECLSLYVYYTLIDMMTYVFGLVKASSKPAKHL
jgi:hypothetical protein